MFALDTLKTCAVAAILGLSAFGAQAATYTPDTLLCETTLPNSGDATELEAIADCIDGVDGIEASDLEIDFKGEPINYGVDDDGNYFVIVEPDEPGYFLLKFGVGGTDEEANYIFENTAEMTVLVWTSDDINDLLAKCKDFGEELCRLSHVTTTAGAAEVPIPAAGLLMVGALGALGLAKRRRRAA